MPEPPRDDLIADALEHAGELLDRSETERRRGNAVASMEFFRASARIRELVSHLEIAWAESPHDGPNPSEES